MSSKLYYYFINILKFAQKFSLDTGLQISTIMETTGTDLCLKIYLLICLKLYIIVHYIFL